MKTNQAYALLGRESGKWRVLRGSYDIQLITEEREWFPGYASKDIKIANVTPSFFDKTPVGQFVNELCED